MWSLLVKADRLASQPGQQGHVVAQQRLSGWSGDPVATLESEVHPLVTLIQIIRAEPGTLQVFPIDRQVLASPVNAVAQFPETTFLLIHMNGSMQ